MIHLSSRTRCQLSLIIATIAVSGASIFIRFCKSAAVVIAFWRLFLAVIFLMPFLTNKKIRNQFHPFINWKYQRIFLVSGFFLSLHFLSWFQSIKFTTVAVSVIVVNTSPIWVIVFSFLLFRETISKFQFIGLIIGLIGLFIITSPSNPTEFSETFHIGIILALIGAVMVTFYFIIGKRMRDHHTVPNIPYVLFVNFFCSFFLFIFSLLLNENILSFPLEDFIWFIALAIGPSLLGHALYTYAMKSLSAQTVSLTVIGESVGASLLGWIILNEILPPSTLIGGILVFIGIYLNIKFDVSSFQGKDLDQQNSNKLSIKF
jgi:drug/metabolite transporter (DMT)-like permease